MKIINLSENEYREYATENTNSNFGQSLEYSEIQNNVRKNRLFLGLIDSNEKLQAAALILIRNVTSFTKEAVAPNGYIIDSANFDLVRKFTPLLKERWAKEHVTYLITNPMFKYRVYNKDNIIIQNNENILTNLYNLNYKSIGYFSQFEKYDVIIENNISSNDIYRNFNRNTKRNIKEALNLGITLHKGTIDNLEEAYEIFKKKTKRKLSYYSDLMNIYNNKFNKMEIFFARLSPHGYLVNSQKIYEQELEKNEQIHKTFNNNLGRVTEKQLNKKINSDSTVEKAKQELNKAIKLDQKYKEDIIVGTSIVIRNNHEIYFLIDGYKEEFRNVHSTHILKWAIIRKYYQLGYRVFNLGEIHKNYQDKNSKFYGQYMYKIGFGGNVIEYTPNLLLVINKPMYYLHKKFNRKK